jgi:hypothetical protein
MTSTPPPIDPANSEGRFSPKDLEIGDADKG